MTRKMLLLTGLLGIFIWALSDAFQTSKLSEIFRGKLRERFARQSVYHRTRFHNFLEKHHHAANLLASRASFQNYLRNGLKGSGKPRIITKRPSWLPGPSIMRQLIHFRYAVLLDSRGVVREIHMRKGAPEPPLELLNVRESLLKVSANQSHLTLLGQKPHLVTTVTLKNSERVQGSLLIACPLDSEFIARSQGASSDTALIALVNETNDRIMISSNETAIPPGESLERLQKKYLVTGIETFDYGSSDLVIKLVSFISTAEVNQLTEQVLLRDRRLRAVTALIFIAVFGFLMYRVTNRIQNLTEKVSAFSRRMNLNIPSINKGDQIRILEESFRRLTEEIRNETAALEHQALHDPLTELPNRKLLHEKLTQAILAGELSGERLTLFVSDLNHFKEINDTLGHHVGDLVLRQAAERLYACLRSQDTVARLGGDEFGILLPKTNLEKAAHVARKIAESFKSPFLVGGHNLSVGISIGIVEFPLHGNDVNILMQRADVAMYQAKRKNSGYAFYDPDTDHHTISRLELMSDLKEAIASEALELHYQPLVDVRTKEVISMEALLRWKHPERGYIPPDEFIPLAEQTGLIQPLTDWVMEEGMRKLAVWRKEGFFVNIAFNISVHCLHDAGLPERIQSMLAKNNLESSSCVLEVTESDIMIDPIRGRAILNELHGMGIGISIDDFGTGYSSLAYIKQLPVQEIKIDRSFVLEMIDDDNDALIVRATIELAHNLGLKITAEGVETQKTWDRLAELGCDHVQGYFIHYPMNSEQFLKWAASDSGFAVAGVRA